MTMFKIENNKIIFEKDNKILAYVTYPLIDTNIVDINHTVVDKTLQGQGIASNLLEYAYKDIKSKNLFAVTSCSYARNWFLKHKEYSDILYSEIRKYNNLDYNDVFLITLSKWKDEVKMSKELEDFIYHFLVKYYLYDNEYCFVGTKNNKVSAFLLANKKTETNDSIDYFNNNIDTLNEFDKEKAYQYLDYIEYNHKMVLKYMNDNSIYLGLIASTIHNMGYDLINHLKDTLKSNNINEIYLWTDETCNYQYYEKLGCIKLHEYNVKLYDRNLKTFIYKIKF